MSGRQEAMKVRTKKSKSGVISSRSPRSNQSSVGDCAHLNGTLSYVRPENALWWHSLRKMICVDLDETLANNQGKFLKGTGKVGVVNECVAAVVRKLKATGYFIVLYTGREWNELDALKEWCRFNEVPVDEFWLGMKPPAIVFIDDRAVNPHVRGWEEDIDRILTGDYAGIKLANRSTPKRRIACQAGL